MTEILIRYKAINGPMTSSYSQDAVGVRAEATRRRRLPHANFGEADEPTHHAQNGENEKYEWGFKATPIQKQRSHKAKYSRQSILTKSVG
jgi:hypothetical protein